jgi:L-2-hydroxyglutarate oxidase LhgO
MAQDVRAAGGSILTGQEVIGMRVEGGTVRLRTATAEHVVDRLIACAGLQSDVVARLVSAAASASARSASALRVAVSARLARAAAEATCSAASEVTASICASEATGSATVRSSSTRTTSCYE